jgi:deoxyribodipyrimidine photolyase-related protein
MAAMAEAGRDRLRVVQVESRARAAQLPCQRKKLVLLLSAMRHYAVMLQEQGYVVEILRAADLLNGLRKHVAAWRSDRIYCMAASEYNGRHFNLLIEQDGKPTGDLWNYDALVRGDSVSGWTLDRDLRLLRR